jgi:hypothetical protein
MDTLRELERRLKARRLEAREEWEDATGAESVRAATWVAALDFVLRNMHAIEAGKAKGV